MSRLALTLVAAAALVTLGACGDKPQELGAAKKPAEASFKGTDNGYSAPGWKQGDQGSWETQMKTRTQQGQNEYQRTSGAG